MSIISGIVWGLIAFIIVGGTWSEGILLEVRWYALLSAPLVGLAAYYSSRWTYNMRVWVRIGWAVVSLYIAAGLYGMIYGFISLLYRPSADWEVVVGSTLAFWIGLTYVPILWLLFPLSFFNHWLVSEYERKTLAEQAAPSNP